MVLAQRSLFGTNDAPRIDRRLTGLRRVELGDGAWIDHLPGWVEGHAVLFDALRTGMQWRTAKRPMYDRIVDVPRMLASVPDDGVPPPVVDDIALALSAQYGLFFEFVHMALYRDGQDSVAMHADHVLFDTVVPIVSVGTPRKFVLKPMNGGPSRSLTLGWGDLLVMGGTCQSTWQHGIPKTKRHADPRISIMFRTQASRVGQRQD
ncbi:MAG: alpha-ketoglutarate-dependent dioxygenase AlkB [Deltaproteobacteria bacterium]